MVPTKEITSFVPITPDEIIATAVSCAKLGARIVHIHPRDTHGKPTWKKEVFAKIIGGIREKTNEILISATTSGRYWGEFEKRSECLDLQEDLKPDLASLTVGSNNFIRSASVNSPTMIKQLAQKMMDRGIKPELEVFEPGMINMANYLLKKGIIVDTKPYFNILLGSLGTSPLNPASLASFLSLLPSEATWSLAGIGRFQLRANVMAMAAGGNIRVGLEDNIYYTKKNLASNEELLERLLRIASEMDISPSSIEETRGCLGLPW
jgi:uncharacterized protein (DUF849 family)